MTLPRILTIMGSGETAPTMVTTHRMLAAKLPKPARATLLDTPYGFQENAPDSYIVKEKLFKNETNMLETVLTSL